MPSARREHTQHDIVTPARAVGPFKNAARAAGAEPRRHRPDTARGAGHSHAIGHRTVSRDRVGRSPAHAGRRARRLARTRGRTALYILPFFEKTAPWGPETTRVSKTDHCWSAHTQNRGSVRRKTTCESAHRKRRNDRVKQDMHHSVSIRENVQAQAIRWFSTPRR